MDNYLSEVIDSLSINDLKILGILNDYEAEVKFKSLSKGDLSKKCELSDAKFRKALYRLEITRFIDIIKDSKEHSIIITHVGHNALFTSLSKEVI